jgi:thioredoxin 1
MADETIEDIRERKKQELLETESSDSGSDTPTNPIEIDGSDHLESVLGSHETVLVDFYADWCGPCQMMAPAVEQLAADDGVTVAKVDVDANESLAAAWGVQGMPTLVVVSDGEETNRVVGARNYDGLRDLVA